jgi:molybdate transport system substrate-binding protein
MAFFKGLAFVAALTCVFATDLRAAELRVIATGASRAVVQMLGDLFQAQTGHRIVLVTDTAGGVQRRIQAGEAADVIVATPVVIDALAMGGKVVRGSRLDLARTGIGIGVAEGAPVPDISTVEAVKRLIVAARGIAYVDPAGGGTSGNYFVRMVERLGLSDVLRSKARPKMGGYAAELVASGEADVVFHQISEIMPVSGVRLVGPLPAEIQLVTTYSAGLATELREAEVARAFLALMASPAAEPAIRAAHMEPAARP